MNRPDAPETSMSPAAVTGGNALSNVPPVPHAGRRQPLSSRRKWLFRLVSLGFPVVCLCLIELAFHWMGVGKDLGLLAPAETCTSCGLVRFNPDADLAYYGRINLVGPEPRPFAMAKPAGVFRIVVIGASTVQGFPYQPELAFPRLLEISLQRQGIKRDFEVLNAGITAITSACEVDILQQAVGCRPDLIVIYTGHNEFMGPGGVASNFSVPDPAWAHEFYSARRTRVIQVASRVLGFQKRDNRPLFEQLPGDLRIPLNGAKFRCAEDRFRRNLERMIQIATTAQISLLLTTPAVNLRSQSPLTSLSRETLSQRESDQWQKAMDLGNELLEQNNHVAALEGFDRARSIDDGHALLAFRRAQCLEGLGRWEEALAAYQAACDLDGLRMRAPGSFARIIAQVADAAPPDSMVWFVDTASEFARGAPHGIPGDESFLEHVHFTYAGNWRMANILAEHITRDILRESWQERLVPSEADRNRLCHVMPHDHLIAKGIVREMLHSPPHNQAVDARSRLEAVQSDFWRLFEELSPGEGTVLLSVSLGQLQTDAIRPLAIAYEGAEMYREERTVLHHGIIRQPWQPELFLDLAECEIREGNASQARALLKEAEKWKLNRTLLRNLQQKLDLADRR